MNVNVDHDLAPVRGGASEMARMLSNRLGFRVVEDELLQMAAKRSGMDLEKIERVYEQRPSFQDLRVYKEHSEKYITAVDEMLGVWRAKAMLSSWDVAPTCALLTGNVFNLRLVADFAVRVTAGHAARRPGRERTRDSKITEVGLCPRSLLPLPIQCHARRSAAFTIWCSIPAA